MKTDVRTLVPQGWKTEDVSLHLMKVSKNKLAKSIIFPKIIKIDNHFVEGIALFLGDGDFNRKEKRHTTFASKDKDITKHYLDFLRKYFYIEDKDISFSIRYKRTNPNMIQSWKETLKINKNINSYQSDRSLSEALHIQVNSVVFRHLFENIINYTLKLRIFEQIELRKAFLRGIFAAEGNIGIKRKEKYINQITFSFSKKEMHLAKIVKFALAKENISSKILPPRKNCLEVNIQNWKNYHLLWKIDLFSICSRKQQDFLMILKNLHVYCNLDDKFRFKLFESLNLTQREIARLLNSWQGNIAHMIKGKNLISIARLKRLAKYSCITEEKIIENIKFLRIGCLTKLDADKKFIKLLFHYK